MDLETERKTDKSITWHPIVRPDTWVEAVSEDVRPQMQQLAHYAMLCVAMRAALAETDDVMRALQYCERTHGFARVAPVLAMVVASLENAVTLIPMAITTMGVQRHLANAGLFVGYLVEELARVPGHTRRFPLSEYSERVNSPHVEFEDCLIGAGIVKKLGRLTEGDPALARPYSRLVTEFRKQHGTLGVCMLDDAAKQVQEILTGKTNSSPIPMFADEVERLAKRHRVSLPMVWQMHVTQPPRPKWRVSP